MAAMNIKVSWTFHLLLVMIIFVYHARAAEDTTTISTTLRKRAPTCDAICPKQDDPDSYTECCVLENDTVKCCSGAVAFHVDNSLVKIIGISVITTCVVLAILVLICCFWGRCPLYNTCRVDYGQTDEVPYGAKEDHPLTGGDMALTSGIGQHGYTVSIRPVEEV